VNNLDFDQRSLIVLLFLERLACRVAFPPAVCIPDKKVDSLVD
jgi:hypothetical protein